MLPDSMPLLDRFQLGVDAGFEEVECETVDDPKQAEAIKVAAAKAKLRIHSVMYMGHWDYPLNSPPRGSTEPLDTDVDDDTDDRQPTHIEPLVPRPREMKHSIEWLGDAREAVRTVKETDVGGYHLEGDDCHHQHYHGDEVRTDLAGQNYVAQ